MRHRSVWTALIIIAIILLIANTSLALMTASHLHLETLHPGLIIPFGFYYLAQLAAPAIQMSSRKGMIPGKTLEIINWYSCVALGSLSSIIVVALAVEILTLFTSKLVPNTAWFHDSMWLLVVGGVSILTLGIGVAQATQGPCVVRVNIPIENLPDDLVGFKIVQISDLHISALIGRRYTTRVVKMANACEPDLIAMTGDFVDGSVNYLRYRAHPLSALTAKYGRFFVTGNHEYYHNALEWIEEHKRHGTSVLLNEHRVIAKGCAKLVVAGTIDRAGKYFIKDHQENVSKALEGSPQNSIKVLLAHHPNCYNEAQAHGVNLQLSGHTHGGQFFPWQVVVKMVHRYDRGLHRLGSMWIYVNPGTGFWGPPLRSTIPAELTELTLVKGA
jgi:uncharacterized protein